MAGAPRICEAHTASQTKNGVQQRYRAHFHGFYGIVRLIDGGYRYELDDVRKQELVHDFNVIARQSN